MKKMTFYVQRKNEPDIPVTIRERTSEDHSAITELYQRILPEETEHFVSDVSNLQVIKSWFEPNDFVETTSIIAEVDQQIIGEAALVRQKNPKISHVGNIRFYIQHSWRNAGLGATLVSSVFTKAMNMGIEKICVYLPEVAAKKYHKMLCRNGFSLEATLQGHYRTHTGDKTSVVVYGRDLEELWHRISDWVNNYGRAMEY